jgi:regulator of RNase E activity RraA
MTFQKKKSRLKMVLVVAAALGCSSASLGGALATLAIQQPASAQVALA